MTEFQDLLRTKMHYYVARMYRITPARGVVNEVMQELRNRSLQMILSYIEGSTNQPVQKKEWGQSYSLLQESKYLLYLLHSERLVPSDDFTSLNTLAEEITKLLCAEIECVPA